MTLDTFLIFAGVVGTIFCWVGYQLSCKYMRVCNRSKRYVRVGTKNQRVR